MSLYGFSSGVAAVIWYRKVATQDVCSVVIKGQPYTIGALGFGDFGAFKPHRIMVKNTVTKDERFYNL